MAEKIVYGAFDIMAAKSKQDALKVFSEAIDNVKTHGQRHLLGGRRE